jgi:hypothetical protein
MEIKQFASDAVLLILALVWSGPRINERLYGAPTSRQARLHAQSAIGRMSGTLEVEPTRVTWRPWKRYDSKIASFDGFDVDMRQIEEAAVYARAETPADDLRFRWSGWRDSNPRPSVPQTDALTKLRHSPCAGESTSARPGLSRLGPAPHRHRLGANHHRRRAR